MHKNINVSLTIIQKQNKLQQANKKYYCYYNSYQFPSFCLSINQIFDGFAHIITNSLWQQPMDIHRQNKLTVCHSLNTMLQSFHMKKHKYNIIWRLLSTSSNIRKNWINVKSSHGKTVRQVLHMSRQNGKTKHIQPIKKHKNSRMQNAYLCCSASASISTATRHHASTSVLSTKPNEQLFHTKPSL